MLKTRICKYKPCSKEFPPKKYNHVCCTPTCSAKVWKHGVDGSPNRIDKPRECQCGVWFKANNTKHRKCEHNCDGQKKIAISDKHKIPDATEETGDTVRMVKTPELVEQANMNRLEEIINREMEAICAAVKDRTDADSRIKSSLFNLELWSKVLGGERVYSEQVWGLLRDRSEANKPDIQNGMLLAGLQALTQHRQNAKPANGSAQDINQAAPKVDA